MKQLFKNNLLFSFLVIGVCLGATKISYGQALVSIEFTQTEPLAAGQQMNVNVQIANGQNVSGYELTVGFDPTVLRYVESANGDYLSEDAFVIQPIISTKTAHIIATSRAGAASESEGTLTTLTFEVVAIKDSTIELINVILSDRAGMPLAVATQSGRIMAIQLPPIGDVNEDGKVNILDLTLVASNLRTDTLTTPRVDVNEDGTVNILDLVLIAQHLDAVGSNRVPGVRIIPVNSEVNLEEPAVAARPPIDFEAEKAAIQEVYSAFYEAFNDEDIPGIQDTFETSTIQFGTIFAGNEPVPIAIGWNNVKTNILGLWGGIGTKGAKWGRDDKLADFWIGYKGSKIEAAAIGYNCYKGSFPGETHLYLVKDPKDGWKIHELDSSTENNLGIFGFHKGKPRIQEFMRVTREKDKVE